MRATPKAPKPPRLCVDCSANISDRSANAKRCAPCGKKRVSARDNARYERLRLDPSFRAKCVASSRAHANKYPLAIAARVFVGCHVKAGTIPAARLLACVDCGKPARDYDHRDYTKPLEVEPTCRSCNRLRGPGYPYNQA